MLDADRLHLHWGPIDVIATVEGPGAVSGRAAAIERFQTILPELVGELDLLRHSSGEPPKGPVARRMFNAVSQFSGCFITPMAAVAGAVADEIADVILQGPGITRLSVNNGGDIAFARLSGPAFRVAIAGTGRHATISLGEKPTIGGLATSGWRGRSFSFGIADTVSVIAKTTAIADAAATLIANHVDLPDHPLITRTPALEFAPDSDLGARRVTTAVGPISTKDIDRALDAGAAYGASLMEAGLIRGALLALSGQVRILGDIPLDEHPNGEKDAQLQLA